MRLFTSRSMAILALVAGSVVALLVLTLVRPIPAAALPDYAAKTGQPCATCHVNPAGGGARNSFGQRFEAIPTHSSDPAGAFAQAQAAAQPTATAAPAKPAATATPAPAAPAATPTSAPAAPAATATAAPAKPAATATPAPAPGALPRTGGFPLGPLVMGAAAVLLAVGWTLRARFKI